MIAVYVKLLCYGLPALFTGHNINMIIRTYSFKASVGYLDQCLTCTQYIQELLGFLFPAKRPEPASDTAGHDKYITVIHDYWKYV